MIRWAGGSLNVSGLTAPLADHDQAEVGGGEHLAGDVQWEDLDGRDRHVADPGEQFGKGALLRAYLPHPHDHDPLALPSVLNPTFAYGGPSGKASRITRASVFVAW